ncbi:unnamed protein product [Rotaria sp. Silwood2]|nr:unnamed protein product [Rotaria sp. Silwood2]CAF4434736.1 unnamed protein product [Rotaria sp. Silwood2]CAF4668099.1 unnamed protein product [Rotaria sp. Silwood2]
MHFDMLDSQSLAALLVAVLVGIGSILGILLYYPNMSLNIFEDATQLDGPSFFNKVYIAPWRRISAYAVGLLTCFIVMNVGSSYRSNTSTKIFGTLLAIIMGLACIFVMYPNFVLVPGLNRTNQGGIVNTILSWPIWAPLARLNYSAYLIYLTILLITIYNQSIPIYNQPHMLLNIFVSNVFVTYITAIVDVILFENPAFVLEKYIFKR